MRESTIPVSVQGLSHSRTFFGLPKSRTRGSINVEAIEKGPLVIYAAYALVFIAAAIVANMLVKEEESRAAQENLEDAGDRQAPNTLVKWTRPFFRQYIVPMVRGKKAWDTRRKMYRR